MKTINRILLSTLAFLAFANGQDPDPDLANVNQVAAAQAAAEATAAVDATAKANAAKAAAEATAAADATTKANAAQAAAIASAATDATTKANAAQAAAVQRANHTGTQAIATVDGLQGELEGTPSYLDRFTLRANSTQIPNGTMPEIGSAYFLHLPPSAVGNPPQIAATGGLVGKPGVGVSGSLFYLGGRISEGIKSFVIDLDYTSTGGANVRNGVTMAFAGVPLFTAGGAIQLPADMLHLEFTNAGISKFGIGTGGASFPTIEKVRPTNIGNLTP